MKCTTETEPWWHSFCEYFLC